MFDQFRTMWPLSPPAEGGARRPMWAPALRGLPLSNLLETNQLLVHSLDALIASQQMFEPEQRLRHLTAFEPALENVYELLATHYSQVTHPLEKPIWELAELQRRLYWSLAQGYKSVIAQLLQRRLSRRAAGVVAIALSKGLKALARVLSTSCRFHLDPPAGLWSDLHQLFRLAERCNFAAIDPAVVNDLDTPIQDPTRVYKKAILFWLAKPYQLTAQDRDQLGRLIDICQENCHIFSPAVAMFASAPMLFVDLASDSPPRFSRPEEAIETIATQDTRIIDTAALVTLLHQYQILSRENIAHFDLTGQRLSNIQPHVRNHALQAWRFDHPRAQTRQDCTLGVHITVGLTATHYFAKNRQRIGEPLDLSAQAQESSRSNRGKKKRGAPPHAHAPIESIPIQMVNQSLRGGCLAAAQESNLRIQVGELIGVFHDHHADRMRFTLAVVRWIKNSEAGKIAFGIEFIAHEPIPVATRVCNSGAPYSDYSNSFLLSGMSKTRTPTTLLTSRVPFKSGDVVGVDWNEHDTRLILGEELTTTSRFARFVFEKVKTKLPEPTQ